MAQKISGRAKERKAAKKPLLSEKLSTERARKRSPDAESRLNISLIDASLEGNAAKMKRLLKQGADPNSKNTPGMTALMTAAASGKGDACKLLIENGADVNLKDIYGETALHAAASKGDAKVCRLLAENGADMDWRDMYGETALQKAKDAGHAETAAYLKKAMKGAKG
jgi:ankyrin repeat protein